jgi:hypothetical protein
MAGKPLSKASKTLAPPSRAVAVKAPAAKPAVKKAATKSVAKTTVKPDTQAVTAKIKKTKLVRDSYTIPKNEYLALQQLKNRAIGLGKPAKKGELLRAGLLAITNMADAAFLVTLAGVTALKTGRPKGAKNSKK